MNDPGRDPEAGAPVRKSRCYEAGDQAKAERTGLRGWLSQIGPGIITGAADDDPAGIATYSVAGASLQYGLLWLLLISTPMLFCVEEMSARIGTVANRGLQSLVVRKFGRVAAYSCMTILVVCNVATIAADVAGLSAGAELVTGLDWRWFVVPVGAALAWMLVAQHYDRISRYLLWLAPLFLLYVAAGLLARPNWAKVATSILVPPVSGSRAYLLAAVALLGTTISPYLIYWQTTEDVEKHTAVRDINKRRVDVALGMAFSQVVAFFIVVTAGAVLFPDPHLRTIQTAAQAAVALQPVAGKLAFVFFSAGLIVSGLLAVPVLAASTSYVVVETLRCCEEGLDRTFRRAPAFYLIIFAAIALGVVASLLGLSPIQMLYYSQVLSGLMMPVLLFFLIRIANDRSVMGEHTSPAWISWGGWITAGVLAVFAVATVVGLAAGSG